MISPQPVCRPPRHCRNSRRSRRPTRYIRCVPPRPLRLRPRRRAQSSSSRASTSARCRQPRSSARCIPRRHVPSSHSPSSMSRLSPRGQRRAVGRHRRLVSSHAPRRRTRHYFARPPSLSMHQCVAHQCVAHPCWARRLIRHARARMATTTTTRPAPRPAVQWHLGVMQGAQQKMPSMCTVQRSGTPTDAPMICVASRGFGPLSFWTLR